MMVCCCRGLGHWTTSSDYHHLQRLCLNLWNHWKTVVLSFQEWSTGLMLYHVSTTLSVQLHINYPPLFIVLSIGWFRVLLLCFMVLLCSGNPWKLLIIETPSCALTCLPLSLPQHTKSRKQRLKLDNSMSSTSRPEDGYVDGRMLE